MPRILFMGTAAFAVHSLGALHKVFPPLLGVVTQPDRPHGRGSQVRPGPVIALRGWVRRASRVVSR